MQNIGIIGIKILQNGSLCSNFYAKDQWEDFSKTKLALKLVF